MKKVQFSKKVTALTVGLIMIISASLPVGAFGAVIKITGIKFNSKAYSVTEKTYKQLKVVYTPLNTTQKTVVYSTSNRTIATVGSTGKVYGVKPGKVTITVTSYSNPKIKATCTLTVKQAVYASNRLPKYTKVKLKLAFFNSGVGRDWLDYAINTFKKSFPNVSISVTASPSIDLKVQTKINAGNNDDMYDIFSTTRLVWEQLADGGKIDKLDSLWTRTPYDRKDKKLKDVVIDATYKYQVYKRLGHSYSIPFSLDVLGLFYHKQFFQKNGWNQAPRTYSEFTQLCDKIKATKNEDGKYIYPMSFYSGYLWGLMKPKEFELAAENGNKSFDYNFRHFIGKQYTSPESLEMWAKMYDMGKKNYFQPGSGTITNMVSQMQLINHQAAMVVSGSWIQNQMKIAVPTGFTWGFMAMPFVSKTTSKLYAQQTQEDSFFIWSGKPSLNRKWAKEFVLWLQSMDVQVQMTKSGLMSIREDFDDSAKRMSNVQGICKNILTLISTKKIIPVDIAARAVILNDPSGFGDIAYTMAADIRVRVALGKKDPYQTLVDAEGWFEKAQASGVKKE